MGNRSTDRLVEALVEARAPDYLVEAARQNRFHDFKSESATPCIDLVLALTKAGLIRLAERARNGEFDATREESEEWTNTDEGRRLTTLVGMRCPLCGSDDPKVRKYTAIGKFCPGDFHDEPKP